MTFSADMRLGSLEILASLAVFGVIAARLRSGAEAPRPKALSVRLAIRESGGMPAPREVTLIIAEGEPCVIGRSSAASVELSDPEVSRRHARLDLAGGVLYVADLDSSNGTFLNGQALSDDGIELRVGDDIDVGNTRISITDTAPAP